MNAGLGGREEVDSPPAHLEKDEVEDQKGEGVVIILHMTPQVHI